MITSINEFKNNFFNNINELIAVFLLKYGKNYINNDASILEFFQNNYEDFNTKENRIKFKNKLLNFLKIHENKNNLSDDINNIDKEKIEEIDADEYEIDTIVDIFTDLEEIKETVGTGLSMDMQPKTIERGQTIYLTALLKPRNKSTAYKHGEMGVIKCKVQQTWHGLNKLNQLKKRGLLYN